MSNNTATSNGTSLANSTQSANKTARRPDSALFTLNSGFGK